MARTDAIVLGAGMVGVSVALHLAKRGHAVALVDRGEPGQGMSRAMLGKPGCYRHFRPRGNAGLARPVVDVENGYCITPMEQGIRLTTGAEFAAPAT